MVPTGTSPRVPSERSRATSWFGAPGDGGRAKLAVNLVGGLNRAVLAEGVREHRLVVLARKAGVAHLDLGIEQAFLGGEHGAFTVAFDGAPFQHDTFITVGAHRFE